MNPFGFKAYILSRPYNENIPFNKRSYKTDPIDTFIVDTRYDENFPDVTTLAELEEYLFWCTWCDEAKRAARKLWDDYRINSKILPLRMCS